MYTAAEAILALQRSPKCARIDEARDAWLKYLVERQLTEALGWTPDDPDYGGWSYAAALPAKPKPGETGSPLDRGICLPRRLRLWRCERPGFLHKTSAFALPWRWSPVGRTDRMATRNRASWASRTAAFSSCSTIRCGTKLVPLEPIGWARGSFARMAVPRPMVCAAYWPAAWITKIAASPKTQQWLNRHFSAQSHPGLYAADREYARDSLY